MHVQFFSNHTYLFCLWISFDSCILVSGVLLCLNAIFIVCWSIVSKAGNACCHINAFIYRSLSIS